MSRPAIGLIPRSQARMIRNAPRLSPPVTPPPTAPPQRLRAPQRTGWCHACTPREHLSTATGPYGALSFTYDGVGNRITSAVGPATDTYTYPPASNRLSGINLSTGGVRAYTYDGAGYYYTYDAAGRMATMSINGVLQGSYRYDFAGRQAIRTIAGTGVTIHTVFDAQGRRIAEYNEATGALIREYVWMGWEPVAVLEGGVTYLIRTDHIGRPVFATNTSGVKVWTATYDPFGGVRTTTGTPIPALAGRPTVPRTVC